MRVLLKVITPNDGGNGAVQDGTLGQIIGNFVETWKPEAAYFAAENGKRCGYFVVDIKDATDLPSIAEPFFLGLNAEIYSTPCMNLEDMKAGMEKMAKSR